MQRYTPLLIDDGHPCRHSVGDRWFVDETYVKVAGVWRYVSRAVDQQGQIIEGFVSRRRDIASARRFSTTALAKHFAPIEVSTVRAAAMANVIEELIPATFHNTGSTRATGVNATTVGGTPASGRCAGLKTDRTASVVIRGHAFVRDLRRGQYELGVEIAPVYRLATALDELQLAI